MANLATINDNILADSGIDPINLIVGTGTVNYIPKFTAEGSIGNSIMTESGANILISSNIVLHAGNYNNYAPTLTGGGASGTWGINISGNASYATSAGNADTLDGYHASAFAFADGSNATGTWPISVTGTSGYANSAGTAGLVTGTSGGAIQSWDIRRIAPSNMTAGRLGFGFTAWNNDLNPPWADYLHLRSYTDDSGGNDNLVMFLKNGIGMRIYQQAWGSSAPYVTYVDMLDSSNFNTWAPTLTGGGASGTWAISITGNADTLDGYHASAFALASSLSNYLPLAGGNMTGSIGMGGGTNIAFTGGSHDIYGNNTGYLYFYGYTSVYYDNLIVARGGIINDQGDVTISDSLAVDGNIYFLNSGRYLNVGQQNKIVFSYQTLSTVDAGADRGGWMWNAYYDWSASAYKFMNSNGQGASMLRITNDVLYYHIKNGPATSDTAFNWDAQYIVLHSGNYNSYAPTLTGGGASGTWGINITGNAATVTNGVYTSRTLTINGVTYDLSANRSWTIAAGVTSILAGEGISVDQNQGDVTISNTGVLSVNGSTGDITGIATTAQLAGYLPLAGGTMTGSLSFADNPDNVRIQKGSNHLNLRDPWNNFHLAIYSGGSVYTDSAAYYFRSAAAALWMSIENGDVTASSSMRAPIYYDSQNTGYYLDPASTSNLYRASFNAINIGDYSQYSFSLPYPGANYGNGRIYMRIQPVQARLVSFQMKISSTWNWAPAFGYICADVSYYCDGTTIHYAQVTITSATGQALVNLAIGDLVIENGYISVPVYSTNSNGISVKIEGSPSFDYSLVSYSSWDNVAFPGSNTVNIPGNFNISGTGTMGGNTLATQSWVNSQGFVTGGPYVPTSRTITINGVTYDLSANRSWTVSSGVNSIIAGEGIAVDQAQGDVRVSNTGVLSVNGSTGDITGIATTAQLAGYLPLAGGTMTGSIAMGGNNITNVSQLAHANGRIILSGNLHIDSFNGYAIYLQYYNQGVTTRIYGDIDMNNYNTTNVNIGYANNSFRAPIFYDSNDTSYYLDPNSSSRLNVVRAYKFENNDSVSSDSTFGLYFGNGDGNPYAIYRQPGAWTSPYPDLRIAFHTGIAIGANSSYGGIRFYTDYDMSTQVMSVNNGSDPLGGGNVYVTNSLQAGSSLRAPIFYDSNNTSYFLVPSSTSILNRIDVTNTYVGNAIYFGGGNNYLNWDGARINSNVGIQSTSDMRAPIFYDSNDTAFYGNFAGNSRFNTTQINSIADQAYARLVSPEGGYSVNNAPLSAAIKIKIPPAASYQNTMLSFTVKIYNYQTGTSRTVYIGGYTYYNQDWYNIFAYQVGDVGGDLNVRFGKDGTGNCVWIGETSTYWSYPNVFVTDVQSGHSQPTNMATNWSISFVTSFDTVQDSRVAYYQINAGNIASQSVSYASSAGNADTLDGYDSTYFVPTARTLTINGVTYDLSANRSWTVSSGVNSIIAGEGISVDQAQGDVRISNTGVLSVNGSTGDITGIATTAQLAGYLPLSGGTTSGTITASFDNSWAFRLNRSAVNTYIGVVHATDGTNNWFVGQREDGTNHYRVYNFQTTINALSVETSGDVYAYSSFRAPIFYDSNDTNYYGNFAGVSRLSGLGVGESYYNHTYPGIIQSGSTSYNYDFYNGSWSSSVTVGYLANCSDVWEFAVHDSGHRVASVFYFQGGSVNRILMGRDLGWGSTYIEAASSFRAPIFYDSVDTSYYLDPNSTSNLYSIYAYAYRGNGNVDGTGSASYHPSGIYSTGNNWLYGTLYMAGNNMRSIGGIVQNDIMGRPNVQWGAGGSTTGAVIIKFPGGTGNYGMVHAVIDIYEYNGNNVSTVIVGGHNWGSQWYSYGANVVGYTNKQVRVGVKDGQYCIIIGDGSSTWSYGQVVLRKIQNGSYYSGVMDVGAGYTIGIESDDYSWVSGDLRTFRSSGNIYMNEALVATQSWVSSQGYVTGGPFLPLSGGTVSGATTFSSTLNINGNTTWFSGQGSQLALENIGSLARFAFNKLDFYDWQNGLQMEIDGGYVYVHNYLQAGNSLRAPIFYDSNDTTYYLDPNNSGTSLNIAGSVNAATYNKPGLLVNSSGTSSSGSAIAIQQVTGEGWTGIFVDFEPYTGWGLYHDNPNNYFLITSEDSTGSFGSGFTVPSRNSGNRTAYVKHRFDQNNGQIYAGGFIYSYDSMRAPIFYDSNDTSYYGDFAGQSRFNALKIGNQGSFNTGTTYALQLSHNNRYLIGLNYNNSSYYPWLVNDTWNGYEALIFHFNGIGDKFYFNRAGQMQADGDMRAPIFYDSQNTAFYLDPNGYSNLYNVGIDQLSFGSSISGRYTEWNCGIGYGPASGANRYEVGRIGIDFNDWNGVGTFEVELQEVYYYAGGRKRYVVSYGYGGPVISCTLVECNGVGSFGNYQVTVGSEVVVSGDWRYLPVYVDVTYYSQVAIKVRTTRNITNSTVPEIGTAKIFQSPTPSSISGFSASGLVYPTSGQQSIAVPMYYDSEDLNYYLDPNAISRLYRVDAVGEMRAPIFYDSNDTNYYLDPNSFSNLGTVRVQSLNSPNGDSVVAADSAMPAYQSSFIHTLALGPGGNDGHILGMTWSNSSVYGAQIFLDTDPNDIMAIRSRSSTGVWTSWKTVLHSGNYNNYAPTLTGGGASGTWGINITGNAATATNADTVDGYHESAFMRYYGYSTSGNFQTLQAVPGRLRFDQVGEIQNWSNAPSGIYTYGGVLSYRGDNFGLQIYASHTGGMVYKTQWNDDQYSGWLRILDTQNYNSYSPTLTGGNASGTWGISITGNSNYASTSNYANSSGTAQGLSIVGYGNGTQTFYQTPGTFAGYSGWASYLVSNHGDGETYYNQTIIMPFWGAPQYSRLEGGTFRGPFIFWTTENLNNYAPNMNQYVRTSDSVTFSTVTASAFYESSDARLKTIVDEDYRVDSIVSIKPKFYQKNGKFEAGYIAQEVEGVFEHAVVLGLDGYLNLSYTQVHTLKIAALEDSVDDIKKKIKELEEKLNTLY